MKRYPRLTVAVLVIVGLVVVASAATRLLVAAPLRDVHASESGGAANALALDGGVTAPPVPGGPGFYSLSAFAFSQTIVDYGIAFEGPELYNKSWNSVAYNDLYPFAAPVSVPNGAAVTKLVLYFWDSGVNDLSASLYRVPLEPVMHFGH